MPLLASIRSSYIPMAPLTSIAFICLGGLLLVHSMGASQAPLCILAAMFSALLSAYVLIELVVSLGFPFPSPEEWLFPNPAMLGTIPTARMSPVTEVLFLLSGAVVPMLYLRERGGERRKLFGDLAGCLGILVAVSGAVVVLSYVHKTPILYGTSTIPMATTTALAFLLLGIGQALAAGPDGFPLRPFVGPSARAKLLRAFVSTTIGVVVAIDLLHVYAHWIFFEDHAFLSGVSTMAFAVIAAALIARVALKVGGDMDRSEEVRKQTEWVLTESEEKFRAIFEGSKDGIILVDVDSKRFHMGNKSFCDMVQYTDDEIRQLGIMDIHPEEDVSWIIEEFDRRGRHEPEKYRDIPVKRKDGSIFWADIKSSPVTISGKNFVLGNFRDITELRLLENQLRTSQKMEAVGTLAGGIAHDFNNTLTGIVGYGELLRRRLAGDEKALHDMDEILRCAERAATLTRQLLTFARRQVIDPVNLNLSTLVADLMRFIAKVVGEHIEVKTSLEKNVPTIHADSGQIEQVLMNLCLNARDAMPKGGRLVVETRDVYLDEEYVRQNPYMRTGRYALLTVSDTGIGMDEKTCARVFEPFFTTKGPDKGTGLGLAMVYGIVKQHGGFIHLYSEPGKGTTFKVYFPAIEAQPDAIPTIRREEIVRGGTETILLAEDEEAIRVLVERTLKELGYTVLVARNGEEAIEIFRQKKEIVLAVLDVVMPRKGGKEAFEEMHKQNPRLKVIFMSGYSAGAIHDSFVLTASLPFLQKPFGPTILARKIRDVLDTK